MEATFIGTTRTEVSLSDLTDIRSLRPLLHFLRFNEVQLFYNVGQQSIEEKCRSIENYLQPLEEALKDANSIQFDGCIERNDLTKFSDHSKLLEYLSEQLLKICNSSREYDFSICFFTEEAEAGSNVINSIIQMPQICRCSNLRFRLSRGPQPMLLPVDAISDWLNRTIGVGMNFNGRRTPQEMSLRVYAGIIQNVVEMCDNLLEVCLFYKVRNFFNF